MFSGIINYSSFLYYIKYIKYNCNLYLYFFIKNFNLNFLDINIGDSIILQGFCVTLIYKNFNFIEFDLSYKTIRTITSFEDHFIINIEKSVKFYSNINGNLLLGHINNKFFIINNNKYLGNFYRLCVLFSLFIKKYIIYKSFISLNGISFTINEIQYFNNSFFFCINVVSFTYNITNIKFLKVFDNLNLEIDFTFYYILNFLYIFYF